jgi:hypothetical protein
LEICISGKVLKEIATNDQLEAFLNKFQGKNNLYFEGLNSEKLFDYKIKTIDEIDTLNWVNLKKYLKDVKIDSNYNTKNETETRNKLKEDIENGLYDMNRSI